METVYTKRTLKLGFVMVNRRKKFLQQQKLFLGGLGLVVAAIAIYFTTVVVTDSSNDNFEEGEHYVVLPEARRVRGSKVEVMEFFSYGCIHCYNFDDEIHDWAEARTDRVNFVQTPAVANQQWRNLGRAFYAMEELGILDQGHTLMFRQIHDARRNFRDVDDFASVLSLDGVTEAQFIEAFESSSVTQKISRADRLARQGGIASTPSLVVAGKYLIRVGGSIGFTRMLDVADFLVEKELAERASSQAN